MEALLGSHLKGKNGDVPASSLNLNKPVLLYFSASWCPPCRQFTPKLEELYTQVNAGEKHFEVIYVSWDQTLQQYNDYYSHMSWLAIPFENSQVKESLYQRYGVNGVPTLIVVNRNGDPVTKEGRNDVMQKKQAAIAEWQRLIA